jgi:hypothetical protein
LTWGEKAGAEVRCGDGVWEEGSFSVRKRVGRHGFQRKKEGP